MKHFIKILLLVLFAVAVVYLMPGKVISPVNPQAEVTDFVSCVEAGYPVLEIFPEQCMTPDGRTFTINEADDSEFVPEIVVDKPQYGDVVTSPLKISGKAKGNWFFEDNIPVSLRDENGAILAQKGFKSKDGNWMTEDYVEFEGELIFEFPTTEFGVVVIQKDNPSGLEQFDASYAIPVRFK